MPYIIGQTLYACLIAGLPHFRVWVKNRTTKNVRICHEQGTNRPPPQWVLAVTDLDATIIDFNERIAVAVPAPAL